MDKENPTNEGNACFMSQKFRDEAFFGYMMTATGPDHIVIFSAAVSDGCLLAVFDLKERTVLEFPFLSSYINSNLRQCLCTVFIKHTRHISFMKRVARCPHW